MRPVIVSDVGEMPRSILPGISGLVTPSQDPKALAAALAQLLANPPALASMGAASRQNVLRRFGPGLFERAGGEVMGRVAKLGRSAAGLGGTL